MSYQPSSYARASLITYTLKDLVVVHNDIAEIAHDFIGTDYAEEINNLIIRINLPSSSKELRIFWAFTLSNFPLSISVQGFGCPFLFNVM